MVSATETGSMAERGVESVRVRRVAAGDEAALAALYDEHARPVYSLIVRILGDEGEAEEVLQDVFAQAWQQAQRYDAVRGTVAAWLLNMARTRALDRLRARRARPDRTAATPDQTLSALPAPAIDPADAIAAERDVEQLRKALHELPAVQRRAIELAYFEGLTQSEIAGRLAEPLGTIKTRIRLGLLKLRDALTGSPAGGAA